MTNPILVLIVPSEVRSIDQIATALVGTDGSILVHRVQSVDRLSTAPGWEAADAVVLSSQVPTHQLDLLWHAVASRNRPLPVYLVGDLPNDVEAQLIDSGIQAVIPLERVDRLSIQLRRDIQVIRDERQLDGSTGDQFFRQLALGLTKTLGVRTAIVGRIDGPDRRRVTTVAVAVDGNIAPPMSYQLENTPCLEVTRGHCQFVAERARERYPSCPVLEQLGADSYFGVPLFGATGEVLGSIVLLNDQPIERTGRIERVVSYFAARAGAELERRQAEETRASLEAQLVAAQKMEAIGTLAGGIAHDFNNILMGILGNAEMAQEDLEAWHPASANLSEILRAAHRARDLVQRILTFSRKREPKRHPILLETVIDDLVVLLRATVPTTINLNVSHRGGAATVLADPNQVHQVLVNLANNAVQAIGSRPGTIAVTAETVSLDQEFGILHGGLPEGSYARVTMTDDGIGMDADTQARIFEPFFTTKDPGQGTGLGLAVVHGIMRDHEGGVAVSSNPGRGTTVTLYFPVLDPTAEPPAGGAVPRGSGQHILLIDDEPAIVRVGQRMLERLGYRVTACTEAQVALERFANSPLDFQLVITDYTMPALTGLDIAAAAKRHNPDIPVLVTTGHPDLVRDGSPQLIDGLLTKPFANAALAQAVHRLITEPRRPPPPGRAPGG